MNTAPYLIAFSTALSIDPLISEEYSFNKRSSIWSAKRREFAYTRPQLVNLNAKIQGDGLYCLQKIGIQESKYTFP